MSPFFHDILEGLQRIMFDCSVIELGVRDRIAFLSNGDNRNSRKFDLMKDEEPEYAYQVVRDGQGRSNHKMLLCNIGGRPFQRGITLQAQLFYRLRSSTSNDIQGFCFHESLDTESDDETQFVLIKSLKKSVTELSLQNGGNENPLTEIQYMLEVGDNVHVLKLIEVLQDDDFLHLIMPFCSEGSLMDHIRWSAENNNRGMAEADAKKCFRQILDILMYLRDKGICHRDISPGNLMFHRGRLVLIDLAMSCRIPADDFGCRCLINHQGRYGTLPFQAPEVFDPNCSFDGHRADLWSAGMILYSMLTGQLMYSWPCPSDLNFRYFLLAGGLSGNDNAFTAEIWNSVVDDAPSRDDLELSVRLNATISSQAMDLLQHLLKLHPGSRWSLEQAMESSWLRNCQSMWNQKRRMK